MKNINDGKKVHMKLKYETLSDFTKYRVAQKFAPFWYALTFKTDFQNYFTVRIRRKFVIILSLKIPPHLKCVATPP